MCSQFPYLEICGAKKCGKTKVKRGAGYEASTRFMAGNVGEKYQSQVHRPLERYEPSQSTVMNVMIAWVQASAAK